MATVRELMESLKTTLAKGEKKFSIDEVSNSGGENFKKLNKVDRLRKLCSDGKRIGFIAFCPETRSGRPYHCATLVNAEVKKTSDGNYIITGIDVELTLGNFAEQGKIPGKRVVISRNFDGNEVFRSYRIDRIVDGTIVFA